MIQGYGAETSRENSTRKTGVDGKYYYKGESNENLKCLLIY
jgi:hypothetical protein